MCDNKKNEHSPEDAVHASSSTTPVFIHDKPYWEDVLSYIKYHQSDYEFSAWMTDIVSTFLEKACCGESDSALKELQQNIDKAYNAAIDKDIQDA